MGGKRHKGVTMNRAKKKKVSELLSQLVEVEDTTDTAEPCPAPIAAPEPSPPSPPPPVLEELQDQTLWATELNELERRRGDAVSAALAVMQRWVKTQETYYTDPAKYIWGVSESEQARVVERLNHADFERKKADRKLANCIREIKLFKMARLFSIRAILHPRKKALPHLACMAAVRLQRFRERKDEPVMPTEIMGPASLTWYLTNTFGLAQAWGVMNVSEL